ncbi:MAG: hypothetical protein ACK42C_02770 [Aquificaceae bacterium]|uniref:hypothetical protein n=1 Tax=Hydrogenobacter sp. Uz 6-8 TaxID=3384828 RepID=UPI00309916AB
MNRAFAPILMVLGVILFLAGQWIAFEIYANTKLSRVSHNMAQFIHHLYSGDTLIKLNRADENVFILRTATGRVITTDNAIGPLKADDFIAASYNRDGNLAYTYTKRVSLSEYLNTFTEKPFALGISLSGAIVFLSGLTLLIREVRGTEQRERKTRGGSMLQEELTRRLKALRVAFAMSGVIPGESLSEAKKILDDIIKRMEGKS